MNSHTSPHALYVVSEIRSIEAAALAVLPESTLMRRAGAAAARAAMELISQSPAMQAVLIVAGPGNNGGDALEVAYFLAQSGRQVTVMMCADPATYSADAQQALQRARSTHVKFLDIDQVAFITNTTWCLVIDGLFGIGLSRPITGALRSVVENMNAVNCPVLALDVPSGLDADTGTIVGNDGISVIASHTITFIGDKPGLHTCYGRDVAGAVQVETLDINACYFTSPHAELSKIDLFADALEQRRHHSHKGTYGDVIVVGGARGMAGAPVLAARAAAQCGAGRVFAAFITDAPSHDSVHPELMFRLASEMDFSSATVVVGQGMGISLEARDSLAKVLHSSAPVVIDADALNLIAAEPSLQDILSQRREDTLITPHPLEAARLLATTTAAIQADRCAAARTLASRFQCIAVLKGSGTIIARPDGHVVINSTGNPALASAGSGDVLAGICGALMAQGWHVWNAALAAVWLHGHAADMLVNQGIGPIGVTANEIIPEARSALNQIVKSHSNFSA